MESQVTTKKGDTGQTGTLGGDRVSKAHPIMECVGAVDELRAQTALFRLRVMEESRDDSRELVDFLFWLLHTYFLVGSACSDPFDRHPEFRKGRISGAHLERLERFQESIEAATPLPHAFVVSAGSTLAAQADIVCTFVRRLERSLVRLKETVPDFECGNMLAFVNRLSDTIYMIARYIERPAHCCVDYRILNGE